MAAAAVRARSGTAARVGHDEPTSHPDRSRSSAAERTDRNRRRADRHRHRGGTRPFHPRHVRRCLASVGALVPGERPRRLPAAPEALASYLAERAEAGLTFGTLDGYCSGIAHRHLQEGLSDPTADVLVRRVRRGLRRILGVAPRRQAHPLTVAELGRIVSSINADTAIGIRDRAVILLGYASAMRPGEVSALDIADIITKPTGILISVRRSKTDQDARGQLVGVARGDNRVTDRSGRSTPGSRSAQRGRARFSRASSIPGPPPRCASDPEQSAGSSSSEPTQRDSTAFRSPVTRCVPATPRPQL